MAMTTASDMLDPQILGEAVAGHLQGKNAFMGSVLVSSGAVVVKGTMPKGGARAIGKTIEIPYFGTLPAFANNPDGSAVTPSKLGQTEESATIARSSLAAETTAWAQGIGETDPNLGDPYQEAARQVAVNAEREMDRVITVAAKATPMVQNIYSATVPQYMEPRRIIRARTLWGDEQDSIVAQVMHSATLADLAEMTDAEGRPLVLETFRDGQDSILRVGGIPTVISDQVPLDGSTMGAVTAGGTTPPTVTLAGEPLGPFNLIIDVVTGGSSNGTATFRFSTDNGMTYSRTYTIPSGGGAFVLDDSDTSAVADINTTRPVDSLVGKNGKTGITATFANGTYNADNTYRSCANLDVSTMLLQRDACAFWYNQARLAAKTDEDILSDSDILAMHLYYVAHMYRRRRGGSRPGVIRIRHNVKNFIGVALTS